MLLQRVVPVPSLRSFLGYSVPFLPRRLHATPILCLPARAHADGELTEVKKSKFLAIAWPVASAEEALAGIEARRDSSASHNCWAFRLGGGDVFRSSDDGEPGGTAGRPILAAIEGEGLGDVCVLVVRWFGGVKLGAGGLVRAYGGAARECLKAAPKVQVTRRTELQLTVPFELLGVVYAALDQLGASKAGEEYGTEAVDIRVSVEQGAVVRLQDKVRDATSGRVLPQPAAAVAAAAGTAAASGGAGT